MVACLICQTPARRPDAVNGHEAGNGGSAPADWVDVRGIRTIASEKILGEKVEEILLLDTPLPPGHICKICHDLVEQVDFFEKNAEETRQVLRERNLHMGGHGLGPDEDNAVLAAAAGAVAGGRRPRRRRPRRTAPDYSEDEDDDDEDDDDTADPPKRKRGRKKKDAPLLEPKVLLDERGSDPDFDGSGGGGGASAAGADGADDSADEWDPDVKLEPGGGVDGGLRIKKESFEDGDAPPLPELGLGSLTKISIDDVDLFRLQCPADKVATTETDGLCQHCQESHENWHAKLVHIMQQHDPVNADPANPIGPYQCPADHAYLDVHVVEDHAQHHHNFDGDAMWREFCLVNREILPKSADADGKSVCKDGRLQCVMCGLLCKGPFEFYFHRQFHHKMGQDCKRCPFCKETDPYSPEMDWTLLWHHILRGHMGLTDYTLPKVNALGHKRSYKKQVRKEEDREPSRKLLEEHYNLYQEFYDSNEPALRTMAEALLYSEQYLKATRRLDHTPDQNLIIQESFKVLELAKIPANIESQDQLTHWDTIKLKYEKNFEVIRVPGDATCFPCSKKFESAEDRIAHFFACHMPEGVFAFSCSFCDKGMSDWKQAKKHLLEHKKTSNWLRGEPDKEGKVPLKLKDDHVHYQCSQCFLISATEIGYWYHWKQLHDRKIPPATKCQLCTKKIRGALSLARHVIISHAKYNYNCPLCDQSLKDHDIFKDHCKQHIKSENVYEADATYSDFDRKGRLKKEFQVQKVDRLKCEFCQIEIVGPRNLSRHMFSSHNIHLETPCRVCNKVFPTFQAFSDHNLAEHCKTETCHLCGQQFRNKHGFSNHMINKHGGESDKMYMCDICSRTFASKHHLKTHMTTHTDEKSYLCPHCDRAFKWGTSLTSHIRAVHTDSGYTCKICGKLFKDKSNLKNHLYTHSVEKPYNCAKCGKGFIRRDTCHSHERQCNSNYQLGTF